MSTVAVDGIWNLFHYQEGEKNILHPDDLAASSLVCIPANQNWQIGQIRTYASDQRLYLIEYEVDGRPLATITWPGCRRSPWKTTAVGWSRLPFCPVGSMQVKQVNKR